MHGPIGLANRRLQPLGHLSGAAGMPEHPRIDKARTRASRACHTATYGPGLGACGPASRNEKKCRGGS